MPPTPAAVAALPRDDLLRLASPLRDSLARAPYAPPEGSSTSIKSLLASLLPPPSQPQPPTGGAHKEATGLLLFCAAARAATAESPALHWVPEGLSKAAAAAMEEMAAAGGWGDVGEMVVAMMPEAVPPLKSVVKETCVDTENDEVGAVKPPKEHAIVAAHQFRWLISQVNYPKLGNLCWLVIPCALTALDHWSPEVKEQGMVSFMHIAKNAKITELSLYEDAILDACCHNIPADDELWYHIVEVSVLLLTSTQRSNPRSPWYDRMLTEMLGHLERQPLNKEHRVAWLTLIGPVFDAMGLFLLAHFRRLFSLFFQWMHADDDKTVLRVLERIHAVIKLTWIRKSPYTSRLVDELVLLYKESATRRSREVMRNHILEILALLQNFQTCHIEAQIVPKRELLSVFQSVEHWGYSQTKFLRAIMCTYCCISPLPPRRSHCLIVRRIHADARGSNLKKLGRSMKLTRTSQCCYLVSINFVPKTVRQDVEFNWYS